MINVSNSDSLKFKIELGQGALVAVSRSFWTHRDLRALFPEYLFYLYSSMRATVPLMESVCAHARTMSPSDAAASALVPYLEDHIEEEQNHADWLLEDMQELGFQSGNFNRAPPTSVAALIGTQHYWALHVHPVYILAYLAVLEGKPMARASIEQFAGPANLPVSALRSLVMHADSDLQHRDELYDVLDRIPLAKSQTRLLGINALQVIKQLTTVFEDIVRAKNLAPVI